MNILNQSLHMLPLLHATFPALDPAKRLWQSDYVVASTKWATRGALLGFDEYAKAHKIEFWTSEANDCDSIALHFMAYAKIVFMATRFPAGTPVSAPAVGMVRFQPDAEYSAGHWVNWIIYDEDHGTNPRIVLVDAAPRYRDGTSVPLSKRIVELSPSEIRSVTDLDHLLG